MYSDYKNYTFKSILNPRRKNSYPYFFDPKASSIKYNYNLLTKLDYYNYNSLLFKYYKDYHLFNKYTNNYWNYYYHIHLDLGKFINYTFSHIKEINYFYLSNFSTSEIKFISKFYLPDDVNALFYKLVLKYNYSVFEHYSNKIITYIESFNKSINKPLTSPSDYLNIPKKNYLINNSDFSYKSNHTSNNNFNNIENIYPLNKLDNFINLYNYLTIRTRNLSYFKNNQTSKFNFNLLDRYLSYTNLTYSPMNKDILNLKLKTNYNISILDQFINPFSPMINYSLPTGNEFKTHYVKAFLINRKFDGYTYYSKKWRNNYFSRKLVEFQEGLIEENKYMFVGKRKKTIPNRPVETLEELDFKEAYHKYKIKGIKKEAHSISEFLPFIRKYPHNYQVITDYANTIKQYLSINYLLKSNNIKTNSNLLTLNIYNYFNLFKNYLNTLNYNQFNEVYNLFIIAKQYNHRLFNRQYNTYRLIKRVTRLKNKFVNTPYFNPKKNYVLNHIKTSDMNFNTYIKYQFLKLFNYKFNFNFKYNINYFDNIQSFQLVDYLTFIVKNPVIYIFSLLNLISYNYVSLISFFEYLYTYKSTLSLFPYEIPIYKTADTTWFKLHYFLNLKDYITRISDLDLPIKKNLDSNTHFYLKFKNYFKSFKDNPDIKKSINFQLSQLYSSSEYLLNKYYTSVYIGKNLYKLPTYPNSNSLLVNYKWDDRMNLDLQDIYFNLVYQFQSFFSNLYTVDSRHLFLLFNKDIYFNIIEGNLFSLLHYFILYILSYIFLIINFNPFIIIGIFNSSLYLNYILSLYDLIVNNIYFLNFHYLIYTIPFQFLHKLHSFYYSSVRPIIQSFFYYNNNLIRIYSSFIYYYKALNLNLKFYYLDHYYYYHKLHNNIFNIILYYIILIPVYYILKFIFLFFIFDFYIIILLLIGLFLYKVQIFNSIKYNLWYMNNTNFQLNLWFKQYKIYSKYYYNYVIKILNNNIRTKFSLYDLSKLRTTNKFNNKLNNQFISWKKPLNKSIASINDLNHLTLDYSLYLDSNKSLYNNKEYFFKFIFLNHSFHSIKDKYYYNLNLVKLPIYDISPGYNWNLHRKYFYFSSYSSLLFKDSNYLEPFILLGKHYFDENFINNAQFKQRNFQGNNALNQLRDHILDDITLNYYYLYYKYEPLYFEYLVRDTEYLNKRDGVHISYRNSHFLHPTKNYYSLFVHSTIWSIGMNHVFNMVGNEININQENSKYFSYLQPGTLINLYRHKREYPKELFEYQIGERTNVVGDWLQIDLDVPSKLIYLSHFNFKSINKFQELYNLMFNQNFKLNQNETKTNLLGNKFNYIPQRFKTKEQYFFTNDKVLNPLINFSHFKIEQESFNYSLLWHRVFNYKINKYYSNDVLEFMYNYQIKDVEEGTYNIFKYVNQLKNYEPASLFKPYDSGLSDKFYDDVLLFRNHQVWKYEHYIERNYGGKPSRMQYFNYRYETDLIHPFKDESIKHFYLNYNLISRYSTLLDNFFDGFEVEVNAKLLNLSFFFSPRVPADYKVLHAIPQAFGLITSKEHNNIMKSDLLYNQGLFPSFYREFTHLSVELYYLWLFNQNQNSNLNINKIKFQNINLFNINFNQSTFNLNFIYDYVSFTRTTKQLFDNELYTFWFENSINRSRYSNLLKHYGFRETTKEDRYIFNKNEEVAYHLYPFNMDYMEYDYQTDRYINIFDPVNIRKNEIKRSNFIDRYRNYYIHRASGEGPLLLNQFNKHRRDLNPLSVRNKYYNDYYLSAYPTEVNKNMLIQSLILNNKYTSQFEQLDNYINLIDLSIKKFQTDSSPFLLYQLPENWFDYEHHYYYSQYYDNPILNQLKLDLNSKLGGSWKYTYINNLINTKQYDFIFDDILIKKYENSDLNYNKLLSFCEEEVTGALLIKDHLIYTEKLKSLSPEASVFFNDFYNEYVWEIYEFNLFKELRSNFFLIIPTLFLILFYYFGKPFFYYIHSKRAKETLFTRKPKSRRGIGIQPRAVRYRLNSIKRYKSSYYHSQNSNLVNFFTNRNQYRASTPNYNLSFSYLDFLKFRKSRKKVTTNDRKKKILDF